MNKTMAFDISTEYYTALRKKVVSDQFHAQPSIPVSGILDYLKKYSLDTTDFILS